MENPTVSIGLPVYNGENFLAESIDSILAQTYTDFELIISDNGSTDATRAICAAYAKKDPRVRFYASEQNHGATWNYNRLVDLANGQYFKWQAHDDKCKPQFLEKCVDVLDRDPSAVLSYCQIKAIDETGEESDDYIDDLRLTQAKPSQRYGHFHSRYRYGGRCTPVFGVMRTHVLQKTARIGNHPSSDMHLLAELALYGKFIEVPEYLFLRRMHAKTSMKTHPTFSERMAWFDPSKQGYVPPGGWRWYFFMEYVRAIQRAPLSLLEKAKCYYVLRTWLRDRGAYMLKDFVWIGKRNLLNNAMADWFRSKFKTVRQNIS